MGGLSATADFLVFVGLYALRHPDANIKSYTNTLSRLVNVKEEPEFV